MSRRVERFGYIPDLPDHRDHWFNEVMDQSQLPGKYQMNTPPRYDQLRIGSCTGNGWARVMQIIKLAQAIGNAEIPSRLFIYLYERILNGTQNQDSGAQIRDGAKVVSTYGVPPESEWPYDISKFADIPPQQVIDDAKKELALEYQRIIIGSPGAPMRSAIFKNYPIVFGFPVPDYFEDESRWNPATEALPLPGLDANWIGGHCVVATGFDFTRTTYSVPVFICDNSWGPGWGNEGRFAMDYRWFTRDNTPNPLASDLWIVKKVS